MLGRGKDAGLRGNWLQNYWSIIVYILLTFAALFFIWYHGGTQPFWGDEFVQIAVSKTIPDVLRACASGVDLTPPFFGIICSLWYRVAPYGEQFLLLLPEIFVSGSIFLMGTIGEKVRNRYVGIFSCFLAATSVTLLQIGYELRTYSFFLFFSSLTFLFYIQRVKKASNIGFKVNFMFGLSLTLLAYSHYYAVFICAGYFVADVILYRCKKIKIITFFSYIMMGMLYLPWLIIFMMNKVDVSSWFPEKRATFAEAFQVIKYLTGDLNVLTSFFIAASVCVLLFALWIKKRKQDYEVVNFFSVFSVVIVWGMVFLLYSYGAFIDPRYNIFKNRIMIERYYCGLFPFVILVCALSLNWLLEKKNILKYVYAALAVLLVANVYQVILHLPQDSSRDAANWFLSQGDISSSDTLILADDGLATKGFQEYYIERGEKGRQVNMISRWEMSEEMLEKAQTVYLYSFWSAPDPEMLTAVVAKDKFLQLYELKETRDDLRIKVYIKK